MKKNVQNQSTKNRCERRFYLFINITPSYKLRAKENVVHVFLSRGYVCHSDASPLEVIHQVLAVVGVFLLREAGLHQAEVVPRGHLGYCQGDGNTVIDAMKGQLPGAHRYVLEAILYSVTLCV